MNRGKIEVLSAFAIWQAAWWAGILPAAGGRAEWGILAPVLACLAHVCYRPPVRMWTAFGVALGLAVVVDGSLAALGVVEYARGPVPEPWPALWIAGSWLLFAAGMQRTMAWLANRWLLAVVLGFGGGAMAYRGGMALGAIAFPHGDWTGLLAVGVAYALAVPALLWAAFPAPATVNAGRDGSRNRKVVSDAN